jgi:uncharacterized membrane protein
MAQVRVDLVTGSSLIGFLPVIGASVGVGLQERNTVSELVMVGFRDQYRAGEVLNELRRRNWEWSRDLDDAVAVMLDHQGKARVQMNVDLGSGDAANWMDIWASLLRTALFIPNGGGCCGIRTPAVATTSQRNGTRTACRQGNVGWWKEEVGISETFLRDVGAVVGPETSAIFIRLNTDQIAPVLRQLLNYGGMIIHTRLTPEQDEKLGGVMTPA